MAVPTTTTTTTTTVLKISLKEKEIAPEIHAKIASNEIRMDIVLNKICMEIASNEEHISSSNLVWNTNNQNAAATATADDIDNAKSPPKCENSVGDLDGIKNEYYQVKRKYGLFHDRSNDISLPPLPPESTLYTLNKPCIHSSIPNNGEILSLPVFSLVYQVEQSDEKEEHHDNSIGHEYGNNYDGLSKNKKRIVLPSSVSRVVKDDAVMKEDEDPREGLDIYQKEIDDSVSSNEEMVKGSRYDLDINDAAKIKENKEGNSNLNTATTTATATATTDANPHPKCENPTRNFDGIPQEI